MIAAVHEPIDIVFPHLPPKLNGIGDHTLRLAAQLVVLGHAVRVLGSDVSMDTLDAFGRVGVEVVDAWQGRPLADTALLVNSIRERRPARVILQFEQFAYGRRGWNPSFAKLFETLRRDPALTETRLIFFAHENYTEPDSLKNAVMWVYQRRQFRRIARYADKSLVTTSAWIHERDFPTGEPTIAPVYSNIPLRSSREPSGSGDEPVIVFGALTPDRLPFIDAAMRAVVSPSGPMFRYVGKDSTVFEAMAADAGVSFDVFDSPAADEVSLLLGSAWIGLAPFNRGVSARRGSFAALLQHGVPTVTTSGAETDPFLAQGASTGAFVASPDHSPNRFAVAFVELLNDKGRCTAMRTAAREFYESWFSAERTLQALLTD